MLFALRCTSKLLVRLTFGLVAATGSALGQTQQIGGDAAESASALADTSSRWNLTLGLGAAAVPTYAGSDRYEFRPIPLGEFRYGDWLSVSPRQVAITAIRIGGFRAGPFLSFNYGRSEDQDSRLEGLGDIPFTLGAGAFLSYGVGPFEFRGEAQQAVTRTSSGFNGKVQIQYRRWILPQRLGFSLGPKLEFGNEAYTRTWFGISDGQSMNTYYLAYTPQGGVYGVGLDAAVNYVFSRTISARAFVDYRAFTGDVADSPLVRSKVQALFGLGLAYRI